MSSSTPVAYEEEGIALGDNPFPLPCDRCGGLTVSELLRDGLFVSVGRRCILCGNIFDPLILHNRRRRPVLQAWRAGRRGPGQN